MVKRRRVRRRSLLRGLKRRRFGVSRRFRRSFRRRGHLRITKVKIRSPIITDKAVVKFVYTQNTELSVAASDLGATTTVFRGNSVYDPVFDTGGGQPDGFDRWAPFYNKYRVMASKIMIQAINTGNGPQFLTIIPAPEKNDGNVPDYDGLEGYQLARIMNARQRVIGPSNGNKGVVFLKHYMTTSKVFGKPLAQLDDTTSNIDNNPIDEWFWIVCLNRIAQDEFYTSVIRSDFVIKITYWVEFSDRINRQPDT